MSAASKMYLDYVSDVVSKIEAEEVDALGVYFELSELEKELGKAREQIFPHVLNEINKYDKKELAEMNIQYSEGRRSFDFKHIPQWQSKKEELSKVEDLAKKALDAAKDGMQIFDPATGEVIEPANVNMSKPIVTKLKTKK